MPIPQAVVKVQSRLAVLSVGFPGISCRGGQKVWQRYMPYASYSIAQIR